MISLGTAYLIFAYSQRLMGPLDQLAGQFSDFRRAGAGLRRVAELLAVTPALQRSPASGLALPAGPLAVECIGVCFAYEKGQTVLHDLSFRLEQGTVLGVLGRTGSGKSTLGRLLCRLYDPTAGTICLGGIDLRRAHVDDVHSRVALVSQEVQLFAGTVRDNLTLFDSGVCDATILAALEHLGLSDWCAGLPHGLETLLASGGSGLSAGQAQLLALTRVFLGDPGLVILDEASSRLDPATEALLDQAIASLLRGRTGIIIAHRLSTVLRADEILILDGGHVAERGARVELAADPASHYSRLLRSGMKEVTS
jgi:ATP-binding cassette subfamily B protein